MTCYLPHLLKGLIAIIGKDAQPFLQALHVDILFFIFLAIFQSLAIDD